MRKKKRKNTNCKNNRREQNYHKNERKRIVQIIKKIKQCKKKGKNYETNK